MKGGREVKVSGDGERKEVRELLMESKSIASGEVDIYLSFKYRVTTIIPFKENAVMNVYLFAMEELDDFLKGYDRYKEFVISVEQAEAIA